MDVYYQLVSLIKVNCIFTILLATLTIGCKSNSEDSFPLYIGSNITFQHVYDEQALEPAVLNYYDEGKTIAEIGHDSKFTREVIEFTNNSGIETIFSHFRESLLSQGYVLIPIERQEELGLCSNTRKSIVVIQYLNNQVTLTEKDPKLNYYKITILRFN